MGAANIENLENEIKSIVADVIEVEPNEVTPGADFVNDLGMDSMQALEIMAAIEKRFAIKIPEEYLGKIDNLSSLLELAKKFIKE